eukprot:5703-Heterococcus_DN1.PRE.7
MQIGCNDNKQQCTPTRAKTLHYAVKLVSSAYKVTLQCFTSLMNLFVCSGYCLMNCTESSVKLTLYLAFSSA